MQPQFYESQQLDICLESIKNKQYSGVVNLETQDRASNYQKKRILILDKGQIVYGGLKVPKNQELALILGRKFQPSLIDNALKVALKQTNNSDSVREPIDWLVKLRILKWNEIESFIKQKVILLIEELSSLPGKITYGSSEKFDFAFGEDEHGLDWLSIKAELTNRQQKWES